MPSQDNTCTICYTQDIERVLPCKHMLCSICFHCVNSCPFCRNRIIKMKDILAPLIEDYDGTYDKELDSDPIRDNYSLADYIFHFREREKVIEEGIIKLPKVFKISYELYGYRPDDESDDEYAKCANDPELNYLFISEWEEFDYYEPYLEDYQRY